MAMESEYLQNNRPEKSERDPRLKPGLDNWARSLLKQGIIGQELFDDFIAQNNAKEETLRELKLPHLKQYGLFSSVNEIREKLSSHEEEKFIIKCTSKKDGRITRLLNATLDEACKFAEKLEGGIDAWNVEMKEFSETKAAGTIIIDASGNTTIEMWRGPHYMNEEGAEKVPRFYGEFKPDEFQSRFRWRGPQDSAELPEMQEYAIQALRYLFPHLKPHENEPMYVEYGVRPDNSIYFIEVSNSALLTGEFGKKYSPRQQGI